MEAAEILGALLELLALLSPIYGILKNAQSRSSKVMLQDDFGEAIGTMVLSAMFIFAAIFFGTRHGWGNRLITILISGCGVAIQVGFIALIYFTSSAPPDDLNSALHIALKMAPYLLLALLICFIRDVNRLPSRERFHLLCGLVIVAKYKYISTQHSDDHLIVFTNMINGFYHSGYALEYPDNIIPRAHGFGALVLLADFTMMLKVVQVLQVMSVFRFLMPLRFLEELRVLDALRWLTGLAFPFVVWEFRLQEQRELLKKRARELHTQARQIVDHPVAWNRLEPVLLELEAGARASSNIWSLMLSDLEMLRVSAAEGINQLARAAQGIVEVFQRGREVIRALKDLVRNRWMNSGSREGSDEQLMIIDHRSSAAQEFEAAAKSRSESGFLGQFRRRFARSGSS